VRSAWWEYLGLTLVGTITVGLCYLALTRDPVPTSAQELPAGPSASSAAGESSPSSPSGDDVSIEIPDQQRADFTAGDPLPASSRRSDNGRNSPGMGLGAAALRHGEPTAGQAAGSLEVQLSGPVQKLGARIQFADKSSGSVALVAWQSSLIDARQAGDPVPVSGLRLVVSPGSWRLTAYDKGEVVIASDEYPEQPGPQTFEVSRQGDHAWVVDPSGARTDVNDPRVDQLAGPWACWQLLEETPQERPAAIEAVWAG